MVTLNIKSFFNINKLLLTFFLLIFWGSCLSVEQNSKVKQVANEYYKTYQASKDFEKFIDFYAEEIELRDMVNGDKIKGKGKLKEFFNWDHPNLIRDDSLTLIIEEQVFQNKKVFTSGYFTPFKWGDIKVEAMNFTTILYFNDSNKIIKQVDLINYPSYLINYEKRKNSNDWILK